MKRSNHAPQAAHAGRRLGIFLPNLDGGGAERMMVNLAGALAEAGVEVDLVLARARGPYLREVAKAVRVMDLGARGVAASLPELVRYLMRERPDAVITTLVHASVIAVIAGKVAPVPTRIFVRMANTYSHSAARNLRGRVSGWVFPRVLPWADGVIAVSEGVADDLRRCVAMPPGRIHTIYNPVVTDDLHERAGAPPPHPWLRPGEPPVILGVGRLTTQKDFPTLLRAFARVREHGEARLIILGEGEERGRLHDLAAQLGVATDVAMPGFVDNPFVYMAHARVFVLSSRWEGLPGALIQAMACGCPVVSTDCPSGPREILDDGRYGRLVRLGSVLALCEAIIETLAQPPDARALRQRAELFHHRRSREAYLRVLFGAPHAGGRDAAADGSRALGQGD
jgi:glycosyltransferase involved in cell wall biosynthesis